MASRTNAARNGTTAKRGDVKRGRATPAQQAARARFIAKLTAEGKGPTEEGVQAVLRELGLSE